MPYNVNITDVSDNSSPDVLKNGKNLDNGDERGVRQEFGSARTSLKQVAAAFRKIDFQPGTLNLDLGGGRFDEATKYLAERGVDNLIFDPFNRDAAHNTAVFEAVRNGGVDTVTCNNVLNVIQEPEARSNVILQAAKALKPGGTAYFSVYEGDGSGRGRQSQADAWQENRKTNDYLPEIEEHFDDVTVKGKLIIARGPVTEGKVSAWAPDAASQDTPFQYSLKKRQQVNPIREPGPIRDEYQDRLDNSTYEVRTNDEVNRLAARRIANLGGMAEAARMVADGELTGTTDVGQRVMQLVLNSPEFKAMDVDERARISERYEKAGTEAARTLGSRRLKVLDLDDITSVQAHINALKAKLDKIKPKNTLREDILKEFGVDIDALPDNIISDPGKLDALVRKLAAERANWKDKLYEFWINAILSGPTTHGANTLGNVSNAVYELGLKRFAEAAVNLATGRKDGATFGEFQAMTKFLNWKNAMRRAEFAFKYETLNLNAGKLDVIRTAIGGKAGQLIRLPGRLLRAADEIGDKKRKQVFPLATTHKTISSKESPMKMMFPRLTCFLAYKIPLSQAKVKRSSRKKGKNRFFRRSGGHFAGRKGRRKTNFSACNSRSRGVSYREGESEKWRNTRNCAPK